MIITYDSYGGLIFKKLIIKVQIDIARYIDLKYFYQCKMVQKSIEDVIYFFKIQNLN